MKYKVGDRVIVKENIRYCSSIQRSLNKTNYISIIERIESAEEYDYYHLEGLGGWHWRDHHIKRLTPEPELVSELETTRFELMEL